jgi:hypothetical protein
MAIASCSLLREQREKKEHARIIGTELSDQAINSQMKENGSTNTIWFMLLRNFFNCVHVF